jgi:hypothetical protein
MIVKLHSGRRPRPPSNILPPRRPLWSRRRRSCRIHDLQGRQQDVSADLPRYLDVLPVPRCRGLVLQGRVEPRAERLGQAGGRGRGGGRCRAGKL